MNFTPEQITKAKTAKSAEELLAFAKECGTALTEEDAAKYFAELHKDGELADDELDNVAGGCGDDGPQPRYPVGRNVAIGLGVWKVIDVWYDSTCGCFKYTLSGESPTIAGKIMDVWESQIG